jgi:hypothetical protein
VRGAAGLAVVQLLYSAAHSSTYLFC